MTTTAKPPEGGETLLFVCDSLLKGEPEHDLLASARSLGDARTESGLQLLELGPTGALVQGGVGDVKGELYAVDRATLASIDVRRGHPVLHRRAMIRLSDGREAQAYTVDMDQARGRRRVRSGDWRTRFGPGGAGNAGGREAGHLVSWARNRFRGG